MLYPVAVECLKGPSDQSIPGQEDGVQVWFGVDALV
jgi:hypothetical protein